MVVIYFVTATYFRVFQYRTKNPGQRGMVQDKFT